MVGSHTMRPGSSILKLVGGCLLIAMIPFLTHGETWAELLPSIRQKFPKVHQISTSELSRWLQDTNRPAPLLVDARAPAEYGVSHLAGARRAESVDQIRALLPASNTPPIVLYCSVGYRSSALATQLIRAGLTNVHNLEGSIFAWANEGRPVVRGVAPVREVHPYNEKWGKLLAPDYRAYEPRAPASKP